MEISADQTKPWWVMKVIGGLHDGRSVFYAGCDTEEDANAIRDKATKELPEDRKDISLMVVPRKPE